MIPTSVPRRARLARQRLLDDQTAEVGTALDWQLLQALAERHAVRVRLAHRFERHGAPGADGTCRSVLGARLAARPEAALRSEPRAASVPRP